MLYWVYVTLSCHNWKSNDFCYSSACFIYQFCVLHKYVLVGYSRHKKKTTFIGGMELVSLRCNHDFTSASSYRLGWYKYAIATQWYQFHTTDKCGFLLAFSRNTNSICGNGICVGRQLFRKAHPLWIYDDIIDILFSQAFIIFYWNRHLVWWKRASLWSWSITSSSWKACMSIIWLYGNMR